MPKAPRISRQSAIEEALAIIDEVGVEAFSMGMLAKRLKVRGPTLYYHFRDKSELLAEVARLILISAEARMPKRFKGWKETLILTGLEVRRALLRHPNAALLLVMYPPRHVVLSGYERSLRYMEKIGIDRELRLEILAGLDYIAWGSHLYAAMARSQGVPTYPNFDPHQFPSLASAMAANDKDDEELYLASSFRYLRSYEMEGRVAEDQQSSPIRRDKRPPTKD